MKMPRPFAALTLAAGFLLATNTATFAGTIKYPDKGAAISFDLPADWVSEQRADDTKTLVCSLKSDDNVGVLVVTLPKGYSADEMKVFLPAMAKSQLESQKWTDTDIKAPDSDSIGDDIKVEYVITTGKMSDTAFVDTFMGFTPVEGKTSYVVELIVPAKDYKDHSDTFQKILGSFKVLK